MNAIRTASPEIVDFQREEIVLQQTERFLENPLSTLQTYEEFSAGEGVAEVRAQFLTGEIENPSFYYPSIESSVDDDVLEDLEELYWLTDGAEEPHTDAANRAIAFKLASAYLVKEAWRLNTVDKGDEQSRAEYAQRFVRLNESLFGWPEEGYFQPLLAEEHARIQTLRQNNPDGLSQQIIELVREYESMLPALEPFEQEVSMKTPSPEEVEHMNAAIRETIQEYFLPIVEHIDDKHKYSPTEMIGIMNEAIVRSNLEGWTAEIVMGSTTLAASQERHVIEIGSERKALSGKRLKGKVVHEMLHALRNYNGLNSNIPSIGLGLDDYSGPEEGLAVCSEQAMYDKPQVAGGPLYFTAGIAVGLSGDQPRDFRDTFEVMWRKFTVKNISGKETLDEFEDKKEAARKTAFNHCVRIFRGTPCDMPGVIFSKDIGYRLGSAKMWKYFETQQSDFDVATVDYLLSGKFDPTREEHAAIARAAQ